MAALVSCTSCGILHPAARRGSRSVSPATSAAITTLGDYLYADVVLAVRGTGRSVGFGGTGLLPESL